MALQHIETRLGNRKTRTDFVKRYFVGFLCVCALAAVPVVGCGGTGDGAKYDFSAVDSVVADFMADYPAVEGVTLAVVRGDEGQVYEEGYGDFGSDRISLIASTSKVLSVGVILALVDDGLLELDRPIAEYLDWGDHHPTVTIIIVLMLMQVISGSDVLYIKYPKVDYFPLNITANCLMYSNQNGTVQLKNCTD